jgi:hypothetical protein
LFGGMPACSQWTSGPQLKSRPSLSSLQRIFSEVHGCLASAGPEAVGILHCGPAALPGWQAERKGKENVPDPAAAAPPCGGACTGRALRKPCVTALPCRHCSAPAPSNAFQRRERTVGGRGLLLGRWNVGAPGSASLPAKGFQGVGVDRQSCKAAAGLLVVFL